MSEMEQERDRNKATASATEQTTTAKRNAFTELLSSRHKQPKHTPSSSSIGNVPHGRKAFSGGRDGLGAYIAKPESYPPSIVVYHNDDSWRSMICSQIVAAPTLLPRDPSKTRLHPFEAFEDAEFLTKVKAEAQKLRKLAAGELRRMYGKDSAQEQARRAALNADSPSDELPSGREWDREIMCGVHAVPSMNHLHVHVLAVDRYSERLKHRKHYNSFSTPFFVPIDDLPLAADDQRRHPTSEGYLKQDFICWRCGDNFGNRFVELKKHLEEEFKEWKTL